MSIETIFASNTSIISYSQEPPWDAPPLPDPRGSNIHTTNRDGAYANATFEAPPGASVEVYGLGGISRSGNGVKVDFFLNTCDPPRGRWEPDNANMPIEVYKCSINSEETHLLQINVTSASNSRTFSLFRIVLNGPVTSPGATSNSQGYDGPTFTPSSASPLTSTSDSDSEKSKVNAGAIAGGVIACLVVLASLLAFILYRKRQLERRRSSRHITPFMASTMSDVPDTPLPTHAAIPSSPPRIHSPPIGRDRSPAILEDELPPPFAAGNSRDMARHGSMYKPRRSVESLPPTEYGYGGGLREWSSENRQSPLR